MVSEHASPLALLGSVDAGGQNVHVAALAIALGRAGAEVVVHTRRDDPSLEPTVALAPGVTVHHVDAGPAEPVPKDQLLPHMPAFADRLADQWRQRPPDAVHAHFWMSGMASLTAARSIGVPVALTFHALGAVKRRQQGQADTSPAARIDWERRLATHVDRVIATAHDEARELCRQGTDPARITVIPCGVDLDRFCPGHRRSPDPVSAGPRRARHRVVVVSRLVERKGIGNVIEALASVPDTELVIAGGPPTTGAGHEPEVARFEALARRFGVEDRVELIGAVERDRVPALLRSADVVACCPWYEPFGMVAVEAMACGVPVLASAVGGLAETVLDGVTGFHVPPRDPPAIATALRRMLDDRRLRQRLGAAGAARARRYGWPTVAARTFDTLQALAPQPAEAARR